MPASTLTSRAWPSGQVIPSSYIWPVPTATRKCSPIPIASTSPATMQDGTCPFPVAGIFASALLWPGPRVRWACARFSNAIRPPVWWAQGFGGKPAYFADGRRYPSALVRQNRFTEFLGEGKSSMQLQPPFGGGAPPQLLGPLHPIGHGVAGDVEVLGGAGETATPVEVALKCAAHDCHRFVRASKPAEFASNELAGGRQILGEHRDDVEVVIAKEPLLVRGQGTDACSVARLLVAAPKPVDA